LAWATETHVNAVAKNTRITFWPYCGTGGLIVVGGLWLEIIQAPSQLFVFVLLLQHAVPTALNLQTVAAVHGSGEAEVSTLLFWQYMAAALFLPVWMTVFQKIAALYVPE